MNILFGAFKRIPQLKTPPFKLLNDKFFNTVIGSRPNSVKTHRGEFLPFTINNLWDNPGARRIAKRIGRGIGSGKGKTSTKGHKGQNARAGGGVHPQFEGGQAPLQQRLPKFGVFRKNKDRPQYLNLSKLVTLVKSGRIDSTKPITIKVLYETGAVSNPKFGVKVLSRGIENLDIPLNLEVSDASKRAVDIIKKAGGSVTCVYRTKLKILEHLKPELFPLPLADPLPPARKIKHLDAIEDRGAKVIYNMPRWVKEEREKEAKEEISNKPKTPEPQFPVKIYPGMGRNVVRKRKPEIYKHVDYKL